MKYILLFLFLGVAVTSHAQKWAKNELSAGFYPAGGFFDSTEFRISTFSRARNFVISYTRNHTLRFSSSATYASYYFSYVDLSQRLSDNTVESRKVTRISLSAVYTHPVNWVQFRIKGGLNYCWGSKFNHYYYFGSGIWQEPVSEGVSYDKWGVAAGLNIDHKIVWGLFGSLQADYVRMFKGIDPNQLYLSYLLGYRF